MDLFAQRTSAGSLNMAALKNAVRDAFALPEEAVVMLSELRCSEPGCPPVETVIAVLCAGSTRHYKLHKALADVTEADIATLSEVRGE
jgi:hypothetical protein